MTHPDRTAHITVTRSLSREQQARRERLIAAARALADAGGYPAVTMHDVADRAGVARATVYRYFATKDHLLTEVAAVWAQEIAPGDPAPGATPEERLTGLLERIVVVAAENLTLASAVVQAATSGDPGVDAARTELFAQLRARLSAAIGDPVPGREDAEIVLGHVLLAALVSLTSLRRPVDEVTALVRTSGRLVLRGALAAVPG
ncbi:TetR/AcrR family transcriptional regulator [Actinomadura rayongensis]|uniref:TetR family transcriptional regulator n=1 Tax=Actinomadura rayongensis TaxID=1429076 RepID=A0A6I4WAK3_9ACTN|nr:TetR/AcrR family transcriptional regulator [Actinomadura rayongensis]MXQ66153.1 TetR family transcriptional regulator [Actinomadura rayongensis]